MNPTVVFPSPRRVIVEDRPIPAPGAGQLLIRTRCSLLSIGTELSVLEGDDSSGQTWREMQSFPFLPGYDNVGRVVAVGPDVSESWIGKDVVSWGGHGAYVTIDAGRCWPIARNVSDEEAAFLVLFHVAANGVRRSGLAFGESVAVFGLGIIGQLTLQLCRFAGACPLVAADASPLRVAHARRIPGVTAVTSGKESLLEQVTQANRGGKFDVVFEVTGNADLIPTEAAAVRGEGRLVIVSSPRSASRFDFHDLCNRPSLTIIGAHNWSHPEFATPGNPWTMARHAELFFDLVADGALDVASLITHRVMVDDVADLYDTLRGDRGSALGVVVQFPEAS
jgi:2-desacetyl-2-hydroxyethyl bacteriochlorophyllide A dehydrogenase